MAVQRLKGATVELLEGRLARRRRRRRGGLGPRARRRVARRAVARPPRLPLARLALRSGTPGQQLSRTASYFRLLLRTKTGCMAGL